MKGMPVIFALLLQDAGYDLSLAQSKGQKQTYRHDLGPVKLDITYSIEDLDPKTQFSGDFSARVQRMEWGEGKLEKDLKPFRFRSGLHG